MPADGTQVPLFGEYVILVLFIRTGLAAHKVGERPPQILADVGRNEILKPVFPYDLALFKPEDLAAAFVDESDDAGLVDDNDDGIGDVQIFLDLFFLVVDTLLRPFVLALDDLKLRHFLAQFLQFFEELSLIFLVLTGHMRIYLERTVNTKRNLPRHDHVKKM